MARTRESVGLTMLGFSPSPKSRFVSLFLRDPPGAAGLPDRSAPGDATPSSSASSDLASMSVGRALRSRTTRRRRHCPSHLMRRELNFRPYLSGQTPFLTRNEST